MLGSDEYLTPDQSANMRKYDTEFDRLTGLLVQSAIDAFMRSNGFAVDHSNNTYYMDSFWLELGKIHDRCERPGPDGEGGGRHYLDHGPADHQYFGDFDVIHAELKPWFEKFRGLPNPEHFTPVIDAICNVGDTLAVGANGEGPLEDLFGDIETYAAQLQGETADTYRVNFVNQFDAVLDGHYGIAALIGQFLMAQKGMRALPVWAGIAGQKTKGTRRLDVRRYASYSSPKVLASIASSVWMR
ncbi:MAG: hypothetical protein FWF02_10505 [Micrococcales bacterium]|nr:hypothetical protein [Micrococcales bacterium]MCL2668117.1 hypothetical protein [Micrococcales bacterium]